MSKLLDLPGQRFGRLVVIKRGEAASGSKAQWICKCDCGKTVLVRHDHLRSGAVVSCGCWRREEIRQRHLTHDGTHTRLFRIWGGMKNRCYNPNNGSYTRYGGRGITVCDEWLHSFVAFRDWSLAHGYTDDLSIDRIDNEKGYAPDNCRWIPMAEQSKNRRPPSEWNWKSK